MKSRYVYLIVLAFQLSLFYSVPLTVIVFFLNAIDTKGGFKPLV